LECAIAIGTVEGSVGAVCSTYAICMYGRLNIAKSLIGGKGSGGGGASHLGRPASAAARPRSTAVLSRAFSSGL